MRKDVDISIPYSDPPTDKLMEFYAAWAENYDTDLIDAYGYMAPTDAVAGLMTLGLPADARILDAGCGTGQAGALMADLRELKLPLGECRRLVTFLEADGDGLET